MEQRSTVNTQLLKCHLCQRLPKDVVELSCCSSLCCWECLMKKSVDTGCTVCGSSCDIESCQPSKLIQKLIDSIRCECEWCKREFASSEDLLIHQKDCQYAPLLPCRYAHLGCTESLTKKQYDFHMHDEVAKHLELVESSMAAVKGKGRKLEESESGGFCWLQGFPFKRCQPAKIILFLALFVLFIKMISSCQLLLIGAVVFLTIKLWKRVHLCFQKKANNLCHNWKKLKCQRNNNNNSNEIAEIVSKDYNSFLPNKQDPTKLPSS